MNKVTAVYARAAARQQDESPEIEQAQRVLQAIPLDDRVGGVRTYTECSCFSMLHL